MEILITATMVLYLLSTAGYCAYLFYQKKYLHRTGYSLLLTGFFCHCIVIAYRFVQSGNIPVHNLHETLLIAGWAVVGVFLLSQYKFHIKILGIYAAPLAALIMLIAFRLPREPVETKIAFNSFWFILHIITVFIGEAALALACGIGILYLVQEHAIKTKKPGFFFRRLPSLELLDTTGYDCLIAGFAMLTFGLITGFMYAKSVWGTFWSWDPKEVWSGITWLLYAALLHARLVLGWRGRKAAIMAIIGFAIVIFTFVGVNFFLQGHHGQFTKW